MKIATWTIIFLQLIAVVSFVKANSVATKRECELEQETDEIKFKCTAETDNEVDDTELEDEIKFKVTTEDDILAVEVEYSQEIETEESETESETKYEVEFDRLVEYRKSINSTLDQGYDFEEDFVVKETRLSFGPFSPVEEMDGMYQFSISSMDNVATFTFKISTGGENSTDVLANTMKIDFELLDYEWSDIDTEIALVSSVETKRTIEVEYENDDEQGDDDDDDDNNVGNDDDDDDNDGDDDDDDDNDEDDLSVSQVTSPEGRKLVDDDDDDDDEEKKSKKTTDVRISFTEALDITGINVFGEYSWAPDAVASSNETSQTVNVVATSPAQTTVVEGNEDGKTIQIIAFSFVNAGGAMDIFWDPSVGVNFADDNSASSYFFAGNTAWIVAGMMVAAITCLL